MIACQRGRIQNVRLILEDEQRYNHKMKNKTGNMAFHLAAIYNHLEVLKVIKEKGLAINWKGQDGMTALHLAAREGHSEVVEWLIEEGGLKVFTKDKFKREPLILAVMNGHLKIVSILLKRGAMLEGGDSSNNTPLHYASAYGYYEMVPLLI